MPAEPTPSKPARAHFCQGGIRGGGTNIGAGVTAAVIPTAILGGIGLSIAGFFALARYAWLPLAVRATVMSLIFLLAMIVLVRIAARGYRRTMSSLTLPMEMDPAARVNVICWPDQKQRIEQLCPKDDDPGYFEPEACRVWFTHRANHAARMLDPQAARRFIIAITLLPVLLNLVTQGLVHKFLGREVLLVLCALLGTTLAGLILWGFMFPRFFRVAPGRVDIVRFGFLGRAPSIETISLRDRPVRLDLRRKELLIGGWHATHPQPEAGTAPDDADAGLDQKSTKARKALLMQFTKNQRMMSSQYTLGSPAQIKAVTIIPLWATTDARTLEDAVFRAAVSTAEPGPLPENRLID